MELYVVKSGGYIHENMYECSAFNALGFFRKYRVKYDSFSDNNHTSIFF